VTASGANQGHPLPAAATVNVPAAISEDNTLYAIVGSRSTGTVNFLLPGPGRIAPTTSDRADHPRGAGDIQTIRPSLASALEDVNHGTIAR
jgi:hypothetical protein